MSLWPLLVDLALWGALALTGVGWLLMLVVCVGLVLQWRDHARLRPAGLAREAARLASPLPVDDALPHVVVQLPTYNEGEIVRRAVENAVALDWPADRLHVQLCDDSTDATTSVAHDAARAARSRGFDVTVHHRDSRTGFKAGALHEAMEATHHDYFLILDVDFVSPSDLLRRLMSVLLDDPALAFVQARPDFFNRDENALTRAQAILLDWHYGLEQPTRAWGGQLLPFNGTVGIWRREAIAAAGGWHGDTLVEDWDLAYRAWRAGWRGTFVTTVTAEGELPTDFAAWARQQQRWATGVGQVGFKAIPDLVKRDAALEVVREGRARPFVMWLAHAAFPGTALAAGGALLLNPSLAWPLIGLVSAPYLLSVGVVFGVMRAANRSVGRCTPWLRFLMDCAPVPLLFLYMGWANLRSIPSTASRRARVFRRTPKSGAAPASG